MTRYMVVCLGRGVCWAHFFDRYEEARAYADNVCAFTELYEYESGEGYLRIS